MRISDWSSDVCSSDLVAPAAARREPAVAPPPVVRAASTTAPTPVELGAAGWPDYVATLDLRGPVKELAAIAGFVDLSGGLLRLSSEARRVRHHQVMQCKHMWSPTLENKKRQKK